MAEKLQGIDVQMEKSLAQLESFKQNSQRLQLETFKVESYLAMFNNCADRCQLLYKESGIHASGKGQEIPKDVECFRSCIEKAHQVTKMAFQ